MPKQTPWDRGESRWNLVDLEREILRIECPTCGQPVGSRCRSNPGGRDLGTYHHAPRRRLAKERLEIVRELRLAREEHLAWLGHKRGPGA